MKAFPLWWVEDGLCACPKGGECPSPGKHPLTKNGVLDATDNPAQLQLWREQHPKANWGIATGDGLVVIDLDRKPGKDGVAAMKALAAQHGGLPKTRVVKTGSGGLHLYFKHDGAISNSANKIAKGIDVRGDNGYVVAPGSGHISGDTYEVANDTEPVPLPDWIIEEINASHAPAPAAAVNRGFFPAASAEILDLARQALEDHGPAIQGDGGDLHTFRAAAILVHDFALTDDEAWPLLVEWNETCQPPWAENPLRAKLRGGGKYGKAAFGCKRPFDLIEASRKLLTEWQAIGGEPAMIEMVEKLRPMVGERCNDPAVRGIIEREVCAATGLKPRELLLPPVRNAPPEAKPQGAIEITVRLHEVADQSVKAIASKVFQRNGMLCEVVRADRRTFISDLAVARIQDLMSSSSKFVRWDPKRGEMITQAAPAPVATIIQARRMHAGVRHIEAVTTAPIFLADGSILQSRGYNPHARVYLEPSVTVEIPEHPAREHATDAVAFFKDLVCDYNFHEEADFSSWLAGLLSPLVKAATGNAPAPLICVSASSPGAGKTLLTEVVARIVTGGPAEVRPYASRDDNEWAKKLTSFVKAASPVSVFDNCNGPIGDEGLDRLITSGTWSDRILGASDAPPLPNVTTWFATGNNIEPIGDTVRRVLMVRIDVDTERPQERTNFKQPMLAEHAEAHRKEYLAAALCLLRAYHLAGRPDQKLPAWGSFAVWSALVRGALVWAGLPDPFLTQQRATRDLNEPENEAHDFWISLVSDSDGHAQSIVNLANQRNARDVLNLREPLTLHHLRRFIARFIDKPRAGKRIRRERDKDASFYYVEVIS